MRLSVKRKLGFLHVRGGRVLRVVHDHQVRTDTYDPRIDDSPPEIPTGTIAGGRRSFAPFKKRTFDQSWVTAKVGDIALEVVNAKLNKVIAYTYISGDAMSVFKYVGSDAELVALWFQPAIGWRTEIIPPGADPNVPPPFDHLVAAIMRCKYGSHVTTFELEAQTADEFHKAKEVIGQCYCYSPEDKSIVATGHLLGTIRIKGDKKRLGLLHLQPPPQASDYAIQPFVHELVNSSTDLELHDFWAGGDEVKVA